MDANLSKFFHKQFMSNRGNCVSVDLSAALV